MRRLIVSALSLILVLVLATPGLALFGTDWKDYEQRAVKFYREVNRGGYKVVTTGELYQWLKEKRPLLIVDTMPREKSYLKNHIPGAKQFLFPVAELERMDPAAQARFRKLLGADKDRLIVFYCGFTKCGRSHNGARWAVKLGYRNVYRCPGGIMAWKQQGFPVESGQ